MKRPSTGYLCDNLTMQLCPPIPRDFDLRKTRHILVSAPLRTEAQERS